MTTPTELSDTYERVESLNLMPGWARKQRSIWPEPEPKFLPALWRFADARKALDEFGDSVTTESPDKASIMAERRNLIMVNPAPGNLYATSRNLVAAYQMILPGERARTHRHSPSALRVALDIDPDTYTVVEATRVAMADRDVVLTPNWNWHGHGNEGSRPSYWIDFLDVPLVQHLESMFIEWYAGGFQPITARDDASPLRLRPGDILDPGVSQVADIGDGQIPSIGLQLHQMRQSESRQRPRSTENNVYVILGGSVRFTVGSAAGTSAVGNSAADPAIEDVLTYGDLLSVPCWHEHSWEALEDALVLRVTDEPVLRALGFLRGSPWELPTATSDPAEW
jgi:gentisate 1,2-dioxygenase